MAKHGARKVVGTDEVDGIYYNGHNTVRKKSGFAFENLGGVFVWEAGYDTVHGATSLLRVVNNMRKKVTSKMRGRRGQTKTRKRKRKRRRKRSEL